MTRKKLNKNHKIVRDQAANLVPSKNNTLELTEIEVIRIRLTYSHLILLLNFHASFYCALLKKKENKMLELKERLDYWLKQFNITYIIGLIKSNKLIINHLLFLKHSLIQVKENVHV